MRIWTDDPDTVFDFKKFEPTLRKFTVQQLLNILQNPRSSRLTRGVKVVHRDGESFFLFPDYSAITLYQESGAEHDLDDPATLEFITVPVYADGGEASSGFSLDIWKPYWSKNNNNSDILSVGGKTDFYEKVGLWPHFEFQVEKAEQIDFGKSSLMIPMVFFGELEVNGRQAYIFADWLWHEHYKGSLPKTTWQQSVTRSAWWGSAEDDGAGFIVLYTDSPIPAWISMKPLSQPYGSFTKEKLFPKTRLPRIAVGCQADYLPAAPFNHFLCQLPVGIRTEEYGLGELDSGDLGSISIYWDKEKSFKVAYQQT